MPAASLLFLAPGLIHVEGNYPAGFQGIHQSTDSKDCGARDACGLSFEKGLNICAIEIVYVNQCAAMVAMATTDTAQNPA